MGVKPKECSIINYNRYTELNQGMSLENTSTNSCFITTVFHYDQLKAKTAYAHAPTH